MAGIGDRDAQSCTPSVLGSGLARLKRVRLPGSERRAIYVALGGGRGCELIAMLRRAWPAQLELSLVTRERWAQIGITVQFLIVVRTLGEFFRLRHVLGASFSAAVAAPYVGGALIAACSCWASVTLYFFRRYTLSVSIALATIVILLVYKIAVIGW